MKEGFVIRFLIVALPAGLLLSGIFSVLSTHFNQDEEKVDPNELVRLEAAAIKRQPVHSENLANSLEILAGRIGERHLLLPEKLESAAVWIESTLGSGNIGYAVERQAFEANGVEVRNLIAELPGKGRRDEIIVIGTNYDTVPGRPAGYDEGSGVAALIALARAFAGDQQARTIRFLAFANGAPPYGRAEETGSLVYARACRSKEEKIVVMIQLAMAGDSAESDAMISFLGNEDSRYFVDSAATAFRRSAEIFADGKVFPPERLQAGGPDHWPLWQAGYPAVMFSGTKSDVATDIDKLEAVTQGLKTVIDTWANP